LYTKEINERYGIVSMSMKISKPEGRTLKKTVFIIGLIAILFIMVWVRAFYGSMKTYRQGEEYLKNGQYVKAVTFYDRSIHWYTPLNPYVRRSADRLWEIGRHAEGRGDVRLALIAFRAIRRSFYAARSFYTPGKDWIERCDIRISKLVPPSPRGKDVSGNSDAVTENITNNTKDTAPDIFWTMILEISLFGWIGSVIGLIIFTLGMKEEQQKRPFKTTLLVVAGTSFFIFWIIAMMRA